MRKRRNKPKIEGNRRYEKRRVLTAEGWCVFGLFLLATAYVASHVILHWLGIPPPQVP